ncbi:MAG: hypothetical protein HC809_14020 [Gammaproteobacteria bacterium]|nr:hypothetical protein [Gammaproteobacteria bacterium]
MDAFNLRWPGGDATLHTDGVRCRITWRAQNGMGGAIENSDLAKRRVAGGLDFAPSLPDELRERGYAELAAEVERIAGTLPKPATVAQASSPARQIDAWLAQLSGDKTFEACGTRRALKWHQGKTWPESLSLKPPGKTGEHEWVVKVAGDTTRYFAAADFAGVCACLASLSEYSTPNFFDAFFDGAKAFRQKEVAAARDAWTEIRPGAEGQNPGSSPGR